MSQIITANRLSNGLVVYLDAAGRWTGRIDAACQADDPDTLARLTARAEAAVRARIVVDPYSIDVFAATDGVRPILLRERIRSLGLAVRNDLGQQARVA